jgi:DNA helicase II / ATP-dependent DNA helicase PcrA
VHPKFLTHDLNPAQREAVELTAGPVCILAGAGTGKTRVISRRVAYAIATGAVHPGHVLVVTFTDKAAAEMRERLAALGFPGVRAATFHAAALAQLR